VRSALLIVSSPVALFALAVMAGMFRRYR